MKKLLQKLLLLCTLCLVGGNAWAEEIEWQTVWSADFSSAPTGMTYSVSNGSTNINAGYLEYYQGGGSGNRAINTAFTDNAFNVETAWRMEFDIAFSSSNTNPSNVTFATNEGNVFTCEWIKYASAVSVKDASSTELTSSLPLEGYNVSTMNKKTHVVMVGDPDKGVYLTMTQGTTTYVDNVLATTTYGYPKTLNGSLGRAVSHMMLDNIVFQTPKVSGFVAAPTHQVIGAYNNSRILTLATLTEDASIKWSENAPAESETYESWTAYNGTSLTTSSATVYAVAIKGTDKSEVTEIATGAGTTLALVNPAVSVVLDNGIPTYSFVSNNSSVLGTPIATLTATLNGESVSLADNSLTPKTKGTLVVTASASGYTDASTTLQVASLFAPVWSSTDYSTLTEDNAQDVLGENWAMSTGGRWSSWNAGNEPYTYFSDGNTSNITVEENLRMRGVITLILGYGLGRNITGGEAITMNGMKEGYIASYKMYNGYGSHAVADANYTTYAITTGTSTSVNTNNGNLLVQAKMYAPVDISCTINSTGYASFSCPVAVNIPEGVTAYTAKVNEAGDAITLTEVTGAVPANTGLILKGEASQEYTFTVAESADPVEGNKLIATSVAANATIPAEGVFYALSASAAEFRKVQNGLVLPNNKAYIAAPEGTEGAALRVIIGEETAINGVEAVNASENAPAYNVAGQRVQKDQKGMVIMNGKKYFNK